MSALRKKRHPLELFFRLFGQVKEAIVRGLPSNRLALLFLRLPRIKLDVVGARKVLMARWGDQGLILELEFRHCVLLRVVVAIMSHMKLPETSRPLDKP